MKWNEYWAKTRPFQSVYTHALVSGRVAQCLINEYVSEGDQNLLSEATGLKSKELSDFVGYLVSLHDIGKLEYSFQAQDDEYKKRVSEDTALCEIYIPGVRLKRPGKTA